ncbi:MAG: secretin N-terminal domain-containing protein [Gammaproteobacteria bacterium]|jgi:type IV pilus assembly protein PilQ
MKKTIYIIFIVSIIFAPIAYANLQRQFIHQPNNNITLNLEKVPVKDVLKWLAKFSDKSIVISQSIHGNITIFLKNLSWQQAMCAILRSQKLTQKQIGKVIYIAPANKKNAQPKTIASQSLQTIFERLNYAKASSMAKLLTSNKKKLLTERGTVMVDERTNSLIIRDVKEQLAIVKTFVRKLDIPMRQVLIEARVANVDKDYERDLGVEFEGAKGSIQVDGSLSSAHVSFKDASLDVALSALEEAGHASIISNPHLTTVNQQTAIIESGEEIPYQESAGEGSTSTAFKKAVLRLQVTPQIAPNNKIMLHLKVNQDKRSNKEIGGVPAIDTQQISTQVLVKSGQTIVLGGVFEHTKTNNIERVPLLGDLPVLGILFRRKKVVDNRRELLIFVTPKIVNEGKV